MLPASACRCHCALDLVRIICLSIHPGLLSYFLQSTDKLTIHKEQYQSSFGENTSHGVPNADNQALEGNGQTSSDEDQSTLKEFPLNPENRSSQSSAISSASHQEEPHSEILVIYKNVTPVFLCNIIVLNVQ